MLAHQIPHQKALLGICKQRGFTLIELMVSVAVLAVLLGIAVPSYQNATLGMKLTSYANNFIASVQLARSEAIKRNAVVSICASSDGMTCNTTDWALGWIVMCPTTDNETCEVGGPNTIVIHQQQALLNGWQITEEDDLASLDFQPAGLNATGATLTICRATPEPGSQERIVRISTTGRPSVSKSSTGTC